jgi:hypothetical protein
MAAAAVAAAAGRAATMQAPTPTPAAPSQRRITYGIYKPKPVQNTKSPPLKAQTQSTLQEQKKRTLELSKGVHI